MPRFRALVLIAAAAALGACSDDAKSPTAPTQPDASRQQQSIEQQQAPTAEQGTAGVRKGSPLSTESINTQDNITAQHTVRTCNRLRTECITVYHSGNVLTRIFSEGAAQGPGCSRAYFTVNGVLIARSGLVCHVRGDVLWWDLRLRLRVPYGSLLKTDWRGSAYSPPGAATQRF